MVTLATIVGGGNAFPPAMEQRGLWDGYFADFYRRDPVAERIWQRSGVVTRHGVVDPRDEDVSGWGTGARMVRFLDEALPLGKEALRACLDDAGVRPTDVGQFTVVTCTGYATPGLDILLARDLGMGASTQRLQVGHMGCYAAIPGLASVADTAVARGKVGVLLSLELTSLHLQPRDTGTDAPDVQQVVAHALFSDAAAAVAVVPGASGGLAVVDVVARTDVANAGLMTWDITDFGFRMGLAPEVPDVLARHVVAAVEELLAPHGLTASDVAAWAVHPGGPRIVDVVAEELALADGQVEDSRSVLAEHGNCSSATILLVLDRIVASGRVRPGDAVVALAFGPGLTLYGALLRGV